MATRWRYYSTKSLYIEPMSLRMRFLSCMANQSMVIELESPLGSGSVTQGYLLFLFPIVCSVTSLILWTTGSHASCSVVEKMCACFRVYYTAFG
ncbi:hypothetical protein BDZ91DRAFT_714277 [Kalaharituber pfeilii]|nr:hypothetical protein BDZ91DRAFT_714277 [Kalaharituber pfeilii]